MNRTTTVHRILSTLALAGVLMTVSCSLTSPPSGPRPEPAGEEAHRAPPSRETPASSRPADAARPSDRPGPAAPPPAPVGPVRYTLDPEASTLRVRVRAAGRLAREGHDHIVEARDMRGGISRQNPLTGSSFDIAIPAGSLVLDDAKSRRSQGLSEVEPEQTERVRLTMLSERILDARRYPEIRASGTVIQGAPPRVSIALDLALRDAVVHYDSVPVTVALRDDTMMISGSLTVLQSSFGITPLSLLLGSLTVEDVLVIDFRFVGTPDP